MSKKKKPTHPPLIIPGFSPLVETSEDGSTLGIMPECSLNIPWDEARRHVLVTGKTGAGKTSRLLLRAIFAAIRNPELSLVVVDSQRTEEERIVRYAKRHRGKNANIVRINWLDPVQTTHYWNCLDGITLKSDAYDLASSLTSSMGHAKSGDSVYFQFQATQLISAIMRGLAETGEANLGGIRRYLDAGTEELRTLSKNANIPELTRFAQEVDLGNRNTETSIAEASNHLIALLDERVAQTTGTSEFVFQDLVDKPTVFILSLDEEAVDRLRPLTNAFLHRLFGWIVTSGRSTGGPLARPLAIFIDEFASAVGKLPGFESRAHTLRKRNTAIFAAIQSTEQLIAEYREAAPSVLAAFNHRILVPPVASSDAEAASSLTGIIQTDSITTTATGAAINVSPHFRPLLLPQEIGSPPPDPVLGPRITFLLADTPPFQGYLKAAFEVPEEKSVLKSRGKLPLPNHKPPQDPPGSAPAAGTKTPPPNPSTPAITNTAGWSNNAVEQRLETVLKHLDWEQTTGSARSWWSAFQRENLKRPHLVLRLAEELWMRSATITEFFLAYVYSNTDNIEANLHYLDYTRLKKKEEAEKRERSAATAKPTSPPERQTPSADDIFEDDDDDLEEDDDEDTDDLEDSEDQDEEPYEPLDCSVFERYLSQLAGEGSMNTGAESEENEETDDDDPFDF